jgi:hypothetical protein
MIIYKIIPVWPDDKEMHKKLKRKEYRLWKTNAIVCNRQVYLFRRKEEILDKPYPFGRRYEDR